MLEWKVDKYGIHKHFPRFSSHLICHTFRHYLREYNTYAFFSAVPWNLLFSKRNVNTLEFNFNYEVQRGVFEAMFTKYFLSQLF
jgi:hypothetical protein